MAQTAGKESYKETDEKVTKAESKTWIRLVTSMTPQCVRYLLEVSTHFQIQGRARSFFHRKFRLIYMDTFIVRELRGGGRQLPARGGFKHFKHFKE